MKNYSEPFTLRGYIQILGVSEEETNQIIEPFDKKNMDKVPSRRDIARISHQYMKFILNEPDIVDITSAGKLKDLYDCRICVNHIAQVYLKGIMEGIKTGTGIEIFDSNQTVSVDEAIIYVERITDKSKRLTC